MYQGEIIDYIDLWIDITPPVQSDTPGVPGFISTTANNSVNILGNERDITVLLQSGPPGSIVESFVITQAWDVNFPKDATGSASLQYDGPDNSSSISLNPGLQYDLTQENQAYGFIISGSSDHPVDVTITVYGNSLSNFSSSTFRVEATAPNTSTYYVTFPQFSGSLSSFVTINAIVLSFSSNLAPDVKISEFGLFGSTISGIAFIDCDENGSLDDEDLLPGSTVELRLGNNLLETTTTDENGEFSFFGLGNFTYTVCVRNTTTATATIPASGCRNVSLDLNDDVVGLLYGFITIPSIIAPSNISLEACECNVDDLDCTGTPTVTTCDGEGLASYNDTEVGTCPTIITRTWTVVGSNPAITAVQTITIDDTTDPDIFIPASDETVSCENRVVEFNIWLNDQAGAEADDCDSVEWTNDYRGQPITACTDIQVTFTATDSCGNDASTTATFTTEDNSDPSFNGASDEEVECNQNGSDFAAFQTWLNSPTGVSDNCDTNITFTNNFIPGSFQRGCDEQITVVFTASDDCGGVTVDSATFTIVDTTGPFINTPASNSFAECNANGSDVNTFNTWVTSRGGASATDACNGANVEWTPTSVPAPATKCNNNVTVTFTVSDICGTSNSTTAVFNFRDTTAPTFDRQPQSASFVCGGDIESAYNDWLDSNAGVTATDACSGTNVNWSTNSTGVPANFCGTTRILFTATDGCGRTSSFVSSFVVTDNVLPTFSPAPVNDSAECGSDIQQQFLDWINAPAAVDNCGSATVTYNYNTDIPIPTTCNTRVTVIFTASDLCGNTNFSTATFSVVDTQDPTWTPTTDLTVECGPTNQEDYDNWVADNAGATPSDTCSTSLVLSNNATVVAPSGCGATIVVGFSARDSCQRTGTTTATFNVVDTIPPVITKNATDQTVECDGQGNIQAFNTWLNLTQGGAVAGDSCAGVAGISWTNDFVAFTPGCTQATTVTFTANDGCGLTATTTASFFIVDNSPPLIVSPARSTSASCDGQGNTNQIQDWLLSNGGAIATDACSTSDLIWRNDFDTDVKTCTTVTVTFTVQDECGRTANTTASFTVFDRATPSFNPAAQNETVECDGEGNVVDYSLWVVNNAGAVADDICATSITYTNTAPAVGPVGCGTVRATIFATDQCNNTGRTTAFFTVVDTIPPVLTTAASNLTLECDGTANAVALRNWIVARGGAVAVDSCNPNLSWTNNFVNLTATPCSTFATVTFTASDNCGNSVNTTATFATIDTQPPIIDPQSSNATYECNALRNPTEFQQYLDSRGGAAAVDVCSTVSWSDDFITTETCEGEVQIVFTATDECGNNATTVGTIFVDDITPPEFENFPVDVTIQCDECYSVECLGSPTVVDTCSPASGILLIHNDTISDNAGFAFCPGDRIINRTFIATDGCGNEIQRSQIIVISLVRPDGPCQPEPCAPCDDTASQCCEDSLDPVPCTPVPCTPVFCTQVPCIAVDCIPVVCGEEIVPSPTPIPARPPVNIYEYECRPVYIYVYNDDGENDDMDSDGNDDTIIKYIYNYIVDDQNSASNQYVTTLAIVTILLAIIF